MPTLEGMGASEGTLRRRYLRCVSSLAFCSLPPQLSGRTWRCLFGRIRMPGDYRARVSMNAVGVSAEVFVGAIGAASSCRPRF